MADIFAVLERIVVGLVTQQQPKLYQPDTVKRVNGDGTITTTSGRTTHISETDLPVMPKDHVYISQTRDGRIVLNGPR